MASRVVVLAHDYVRRAMAGPAIRALELTRQLHRAGLDVTLGVPASTDLEGEPFPLVAYDPPDQEAMKALVRGADAVVVQGWILEHHPGLREVARTLVVDLYDPFPLEYLATVEDGGSELPGWDDVLGTLLEQARLGDFLICASERQRDFWVGVLLALNRVSPATYGADPSLRSLVDVVPFGIPSAPPQRAGPGLRETLGLGAGEVVLLWGGGVYNWFDPLTLIRAVARVAASRPEIRLVFLAASHPNPDVPAMAMLRRARELARELHVDGGAVVFNERWVPYEDRGAWLLDADLGVSTHLEHVETRLSFRTRILDYLWAGLPVLCTRGDSLADLVEARDLGLTVPPEDVDATSAAIEALVADAALRQAMAARVAEAARELTWERAAEPLVRYCADPRPAPDLAGLPAGEAVAIPLRSDAERRARMAGPAPLPARVARKLRDEGPAGVARAARRRILGRGG